MRTLKDLMAAQIALNDAAAAYWDAHIAPRVAACKSREELNVILGEVSRACADDEGQIREMPADFSVRFVIAASAFPSKRTSRP